MCRVIEVSRSGYFAWLKRTPSQRAQEDEQLTNRIRTIYTRSKGTYGAARIHPDNWLIDGGFVKLTAIAALDEQGICVFGPVPEPKDESRDRYVPLASDAPAVATWRQRMGTQAAKKHLQTAQSGRVAQCPSPQSLRGVTSPSARTDKSTLCRLVGRHYPQFADLVAPFAANWCAPERQCLTTASRRS